MCSNAMRLTSLLFLALLIYVAKARHTHQNSKDVAAPQHHIVIENEGKLVIIVNGLGIKDHNSEQSKSGEVVTVEDLIEQLNINDYAKQANKKKDAADELQSAEDVDQEHEKSIEINDISIEKRETKSKVERKNEEADQDVESVETQNEVNENNKQNKQKRKQEEKVQKQQRDEKEKERKLAQQQEKENKRQRTQEDKVQKNEKHKQNDKEVSENKRHNVDENAEENERITVETHKNRANRYEVNNRNENQHRNHHHHQRAENPERQRGRKDKKIEANSSEDQDRIQNQEAYDSKEENLQQKIQKNPNVASDEVQMVHKHDNELNKNSLDNKILRPLNRYNAAVVELRAKLERLGYSTAFRHDIADQQMLQKEIFLLDLLYNVNNELTDENLIALGATLTIDSTNYENVLDADMLDFLQRCINGNALSKREHFIVLNEQHLQQLNGLNKLLQKANSWHDFQRLASFARMHLNSELFVNGLLMAVRARPDTRNLMVPVIEEILPNVFLNDEVLLKAQKINVAELMTEIKQTNTQQYQSNQNVDWSLQPKKTWQEYKQERLNKLHMLEENTQQNNDNIKITIDDTENNDDESQIKYLTDDLGLNRFWYSLTIDNLAKIAINEAELKQKNVLDVTDSEELLPIPRKRLTTNGNNQLQDKSVEKKNELQDIEVHNEINKDKQAQNEMTESNNDISENDRNDNLLPMSRRRLNARSRFLNDSERQQRLPEIKELNDSHKNLETAALLPINLRRLAKKINSKETDVITMDNKSTESTEEDVSTDDNSNEPAKNVDSIEENIEKSIEDSIEDGSKESKEESKEENIETNIKSDLNERISDNSNQRLRLFVVDKTGNKEIEISSSELERLADTNEESEEENSIEEPKNLRKTRSIDTLPTLNSEALQTQRSGEILINKWQQLLARLNLERLSAINIENSNAINLNNQIQNIFNRNCLRDINDSEQQQLLESWENHLRATIENEMQILQFDSKQQQRQQQQRQQQQLLNVIGDILLGRISNADLKATHIWPQIMKFTKNPQKMPLLNERIVTCALERIIGIVEEYTDKLTTNEITKITASNIKVNEIIVDKLITYMETEDIDLINAINNKELNMQTATEFITKLQKPLLAQQKQLNHKDFSIKINLHSQQTQNVVVRILLGPALKTSDNLDILNAKRRNFMLLDAFAIELNVGENNIKRKSKDITWTAKDITTYTQMYKNVMQAIDGAQEMALVSNVNIRFPHRLLLPKGSANGLPLQLLVIVTPQNERDQHFQEHSDADAANIATLNLDALPFNFPLDRQIDNLQELMNTNMQLKDILIYFEE